MVRFYGNAPYRICLVHGGPGAIGSLKGFAKELSERSDKGVVEAIQSKYSIPELIEELHTQIQDNLSEGVTLIGHSWGAWLVILYAERYPEGIGSIVLVGCPPLEDKYVGEISSRRFGNLTEENRVILQRLIDQNATAEDFRRMPMILEKSDNYSLINLPDDSADSADNRMYNMVWKEAAQLRTEGILLDAFTKVKANLYLIQGAIDPHPFEGVIEPLKEIGRPCESYLLEKCGHSPYLEKYAREEFYHIIIDSIL